MEFFFTAPWEPIVTRRGDALGLRNVSDSFAELLAPEMSNRTYDGRWVTILAWCLCRSHDAFFASEKTSEITRDNQRTRYAWLRPLELMWAARTMMLLDDEGKGRPISGKHSVARWIKNGCDKHDRFGMSPDQFKAYRQTGMYGGYRVAFRKWPNLTDGGDGWTPLDATRKLAKWLDRKLGSKARPTWPLFDPDRPPQQRWRDVDGKEHEWWLRKWPEYIEKGSNADFNTLPRPRDEFELLPESQLLRPIIFGEDTAGKQRFSIAKTIEESQASDHPAICTEIGKSAGDDQPLSLLPHFSRLADAGMVAMECVANALVTNPKIKFQEVLGRDGTQSVCTELFEAARAWPRDTKISLRFLDSIHQFADSFCDKAPAAVLRSLLEHHQQFGGGRRWFVLNGDSVEPCSAFSSQSFRYRFRLWQLCRLAVQCGLIEDMPGSLKTEVDYDDTEDAIDE